MKNGKALHKSPSNAKFYQFFLTMVKSTTWKRGKFTHSFQLSSLWGVDVKLLSNIQKESLLAKALRAKTEKVTHITKHNGS